MNLPRAQTVGAAITAALILTVAVANAHAAGGEGDHGNPVVDMIAKLLNFVILAGTLVYFLKSPFNQYLTNRKTQIRSDLVRASDMKAAAAAQLVAVDEKLAALPAELDALRKTGATEVATEEARIRAIAEKERERLLSQMQRQVEQHSKAAERDLIRLAADRAVAAATSRIEKTMTPADHARLQDRYVGMVGK
jgi:F-type H+-transporting ATPase subunit b